MTMTLKKILWPTDFSENAAQALSYVTSLSEMYQAEVHVLYVLEPLAPVGAWYGDFDPSEIEKMQNLERERAEKRLGDICESYLHGCPLYIRHTAIGDPAGEILKLIDKEGPELVVMATRGRKGHFAFGSVAEKVVKHSRVPVLAIPVH
jgi:nucleotide-binding universal stress UspA family protein